jgi:TamB, inner membrane protein subunit of TAM complex
LQADVGGGEVSGGGELRLQGREFAGLSFDLDLQDVAYTAPGEIPLHATGRVKVDSNAEKTFDVGGDLRLTDLRFTRDLSLDKLTPSFKRRPTVTRTLDKGSEQVNFNLDMRADNIEINDNLAHVQAKTDRLTLTGTNVRPGLIGTITATRGELYFNNVTYNLVSGIVEMTDRYQIFPRFDLRMRAEACGAKMEVNVSGTVDEYKIDGRGRDPQGVLPVEDVLSCLALGYRASDQSRAGVTGQSGASQAGVSVLSTVTGLDQKIKRFIPVDQIRFGYGFSMRTLKNTPQVTVTKDLYGGLKLSLTSSLVDTNDQTLELKIPVLQYTDATVGWTNTNDVPNDFGIDLRSHINF